MADQEEHESEFIDTWIREAGDPTVQPDAGHVERLRQMLLDRTEPERRPVRWRRRVSLVAVAGVGIAAALLIGLFPWGDGSSAGWAQVVEAVQAKQWIHGVLEAPTSEVHEIWYSPSLGIAASREGEVVTHYDLRRKIRHTYEPARGTIVRAPMPEIVGQEAQFLDAVFSEISRGDTEIDSPIPRAELVNQHRREVEREGRKWIEYELSLRLEPDAKSSPRPTGSLVFRVDPQTRLPRSLHVVMRADGRVLGEQVYEFDYPDKGPSDIYALGVPRSAKIDDRTATGDLSLPVDFE